MRKCMSANATVTMQSMVASIQNRNGHRVDENLIIREVWSSNISAQQVANLNLSH